MQFAVLNRVPNTRLRTSQGFLRRVHRWPMYTGAGDSPTAAQEKVGTPSDLSWTPTGSRPEQPLRHAPRAQEPLPTVVSAGAELVTARATASNDIQPLRRTSLAESTLEQLRNREAQKHRDTFPTRRTRGQRSDSIATVTSEYYRRQPLSTAFGTSQITPPSPRNLMKVSPDIASGADLVDSEHSSGGLSVMTISRPRLSRSPSIPVAVPQVPGPPYPSDLKNLLDGEHHTDELCTRFEVGLPVLEQWLRIIGGGENGDFGQVAIIYR